MARPNPAPLPDVLPDPLPSIRLIAADLDGTLLDDTGELHDHFWPLVHELHRRGVVFCPASGRQYWELLQRFSGIADDVVFIAENGTYVVQRGAEISSDCITAADSARLVAAVRANVAAGADAGAVVCGKRTGYVERSDARFLDTIGHYFARLEVVDDLTATPPDDDILKVSIYDFDSSELSTAPAVAAFRDTHTVTVSSAHWVDITSATANKGAAIRALQATYGITPAQTMVFGDFLNDREMMDTADWSFAMGNAHPELMARARYLAPTNTENGVVRTISRLLDLDWH